MIAVFCVAPLLWGTMSVASVEHKLPEFRSSQRYAVLVDWLNANSKSDCSVLIREYDEPLERLIPGYTHCDTYSTTYAFSGIPRERVLHNLLLRMRLLSIAPEDARNYMFSEESQVRGYFFDDWNQMFGNGHDPWFLSLVDRLDAEYAEFAKGDLKAQVLAYRMDYLVSESSIPPSVLHELPGLSLVASLPGFAIYAFEPE